MTLNPVKCQEVIRVDELIECNLLLLHNFPYRPKNDTVNAINALQKNRMDFQLLA